MIGNYKNGIWMVRAIIGITVILQRCRGVSTDDLLQAQRVVNSSITLPCNKPDGLTLETVRWILNSSVFLTYFVRDNYVSPLIHDPRYSLTDHERLDIWRLKKSDSGEYACRLTFVEPRDDLISSVYVTVLDGCTVWEYKPPLLGTTHGCSSGDVVTYAQQCNFTCEEGFRLVGNASAECQGNGELTNQPPQCEGVTCLVDKLPPHLIDINTKCWNGSHVRYGTICDFECTAGYSIDGNRKVRVTCDDENVPDFPKCKDEVGQQNRGTVALISLCVFLFIAVIIIGTFLWRRRTRNNGLPTHVDKNDNANSAAPLKENEDLTDGQLELDETIPLNQSEYQTTNVQIEPPPDLNQSFEKANEVFMGLLHEQVGESLPIMTKILQTLERAELSIIHSFSGLSFSAKEALYSNDQHSVAGAFVEYVAEIVNCVEQSNPNMAEELIDAIISKSGMHGGTEATFPEMTTANANFEEGDLAAIESFFNVVHPPFVSLLGALRHSNYNKAVKGQKTADIFNMYMHTTTEKKGESMEAKTLSSTSKKNPSTLAVSICSTASKFDNYFAGRCIRIINKNEHPEDKIHMRYRMLNIMMEPLELADDF